MTGDRIMRESWPLPSSRGGSIPRNSNDIIERMTIVRTGTWEYDEREKKNITVIKKQEWFEDFLNTFLYDSNMSKYLPTEDIPLI